MFRVLFRLGKSDVPDVSTLPSLMKWFNERSITPAFAVIVIFLAINAVLSFRALSVLIENERQMAQTTEVIASFEQLLSVMRDAETGQRGYIITGNDSYLDPYRDALARIDSQLIYANRLTADNPVHLQNLARLEELIRRRFIVLERNIILRREQGIEVARSAILEGVGKQIMDSIRVMITGMENHERAILTMRLEKLRTSGDQATYTFIVANVVGVILVIIVYVLLNRDVRLRVQREHELRAAHNELENRVRERTAELTETNAALTAEIGIRRRAESRLQEFTVELERSNRELQDFAFVASHDLQEPLRKIQAFGDRLKTRYADQLDEGGHDYIGRMQAAAHRMHTLINDLLSFSRVSSKGKAFMQVDLGTVVHEVLVDLEARIQQTGGHVEIETLPFVEADALQMRQLFQNLIGNALKFHRPGVPPHVVVRGEIIPPLSDMASPLCEIRVQDNGIGFEEQYIEKIFTPFQRLHSRAEYEGTGMGLAVCRKIVERHRGTITAHSLPGSGTTFIVQLPVRQNNISKEI